MDPITALSLASAILAFIEHGARVVSGAVRIYGSPSGLTEENCSVETVAAEMRNFTSKLRTANDDHLSGDEKGLSILACECDSLSRQIVELVNKLKPKDPKSKTASLLAGLKSKWYEADRQRLEERLGHCRAQLALQLSHLSSSKVSSQLDALIASARYDTAKFQQLSSKVSQLGQDLAALSLDSTAKGQLRSLCDLSEHATNLLAQQCTLKSLAFENMYGRYEAVDAAHYRTFRWIFGQSPGFESEDRYTSDPRQNEDIGQRWEEKIISNKDGIAIAVHDEDDSDIEDYSKPPIDPAKMEAKAAFLKWLSDGDGIFHISGKLGSGKSTLMKYLCEHKVTKILLRRWAAGRKLVFASFFFWKPGSKLQKSLTGLLRCLLHDVLQASPLLIPHVLPDQWENMRSTPWQALTEIRFSDKDIREAFQRLISDDKPYQDHCFCFFIDGLDEFEGTVQDDAKFLVDQLHKWTAMAPANVKLCVSSREYNVFMNAFPDNRRLRLHQLTRVDMDNYVADKLRHLKLGGTKATLKRTVVDNAHGIFLWVALVTKRIREQIENGVSGKDLECEIDTLPQELDGLFSHLLDSLPDADLKRAYQTFAILLELSKYQYARPDHLYMSILAYSFLDDYNKKPPSTPVLQVTELDAHQCAERAVSTLKRVNGYCRGFVEAVATYSDASHKDSTYDRALEFTHRSVPEFLSTKTRTDRMRSLIGEFNAVDAFTHLILAELLAYPLSLRRQNGGGAVARLVALRTECNLDHPPYPFLETLSATTTRARARLYPPLIRMSSVQMHIFNGTGYELIAHCNNPERLQAAGAQPPQHPIYQAVFSGKFDYVKWKLSHYHTTDPEICLQIILFCIVKLRPASPVCQKEVLETVRLLISRGLTPQMLTDISRLPVEASETHDLGSAHMSANITIWQHLLLTCYDLTLWDMRSDLAWLGRILEVYLEHGADPYFELYVTEDVEGDAENHDPKPTDKPSSEVAEEEDWMSDWGSSGTQCARDWVFTVIVGRERRELQLRYSSIAWRQQLLDRTYSFSATSLSEFIRLFKFENEDKLLQLTESSMRLFEGKVEDETEGSLTNDAETPRRNVSYDVQLPHVALADTLTIYWLIPIALAAFGTAVAMLMRV
ncbi:hypothetical protein DL765_002626 [Monosporascus sp. GIB2]|nr:hypothetical protein DL765_002626 [Monosporascus sp. GIB2]